MGYIRTEVFDRAREAGARGARVDRCGRQPDTLCPSLVGPLEIDVRGLVQAAAVRASPNILHGEQGHFMTLLAQPVHQLEQVDLGSAEGKAIFVAEQDL